MGVDQENNQAADNDKSESKEDLEKVDLPKLGQTQISINNEQY